AGILDLYNPITVITPGSTLSAAQIIRSGTTGTLSGSSTSNLTVNGTSALYFTTGSQLLKNLTVAGGTATLNTALSITGGSAPGTVTVSAGTLNTSGILTLKSDAGGTASVANSAGSITGNVTVERYISSLKGWRLLSIPTGGAQTFKQAWQEGATNATSNPVTGYGIQITSNRSSWLADGFDKQTGAPSVKVYNPATDNFTGIASTNNAINSTTGYFAFIRGDRTVSTYNAVPTPTILRTKGLLYQGDQADVTIPAGKFAAIGNPYASSIDMRPITKSGVRDFFYLWDTKLGGYYGYGGYQTFSYNGAGNYVITPGGGSYGASGSAGNYIASGQAFMMQATTGSTGIVSFEEIDKATGSAAQISGATKGTMAELRANLYGINPDNSSYMADGVLVNYDDSYSNAVDDFDATKSLNAGENLSVKRDGGLLVIERRHSLVANDTIFLNLANVKAQPYRFAFTMAKLLQPGLTASLDDKYLKTSTPLAADSVSYADFTVENIPGSSAPDRFSVVFKTAGILPVTFTNVNAYLKNKFIDIAWNVANEMNVKQYEVEKIKQGKFYTIAVVLSDSNRSNNKLYAYTDDHVVTGANTYRIKSVNADGKELYSEVKLVNIDDAITNDFINAYISSGNIHITLHNMPAGNYGISLTDNSGQVLIKKKLQHGTSSDEIVAIPKSMSHGIYTITIVTPVNEVKSVKIKY
ncbi:MAG: hypothetical protein M3R50_02380, partial [Bacteroidota bacterium]|nr:hypothetical protein [Bacteroidota bacterium]